MSLYVSTLESLPNEILFDLYEYFDAQQLYNIFHNLNSRFNYLLQSITNLSIHFRSSDTSLLLNDVIIYSSQIHSLTIYSQPKIKVNQFRNLRNLKIFFPTTEQIFQINTESLPFIEYLSILFTAAKPSICLLYQKIFSNGLPSLKSCRLYGDGSSLNTSQWSQSPNLRYLHSSLNDPSMVNACPNLYSLILDLPILDDISTRFRPHLNLKRLKLIITTITWSTDDDHFEMLFTLLPNLIRFCLHKTFSIINSIDVLVNYDWLSGILTRCLPSLKRFVYHLYICNLFDIDQTDFDEQLPRIRENFTKIYKNQPKFSLRIE